MITKVTITGADDSINPSDLLEITKQYPFIEWGILASKKSMGQPRFPSSMWISRLHEFKEKGSFDSLKLSCHVCGSWVKETLMGDFTGIKSLPLSMFERMQLNTHGEKHHYSPDGLMGLKDLGLEIIFQNDNVNDGILSLAKAYKLNCSSLFDLSHGVGKLPSDWPELLSYIKCGYAGGLSPDNLKEQIARIEEKSGDTEIWIDMETHVRSNNDKQFDLDKVKQCLQIAAENCKALVY